MFSRKQKISELAALEHHVSTSRRHSMKTIIEEQHESRVDAYFAGLEPYIRPLAEAVRAFLRAAVPDFKEELKYGIPFYMYKGWVCFVNAAKTHVDIGFTAGVELSDSYGLFDQRGLKQVRHIKIESLEFLELHNNEIINYLIEASVRNDNARQAKPTDKNPSGFVRTSSSKK
jgi:hypothetical protein